MITKVQKNKLKKYLKNDYVDDVLSLLKEQKVVNRNGNPYHESMIRLVLNGDRANQKIKSALYQVYANRKHADEQLKAMLETKKPEVTASGN